MSEAQSQKEMNPSDFGCGSVVHNAMQDQFLMKGRFEGIIGATLWMPGCSLADIASAAALESPAAK